MPSSKSVPEGKRAWAIAWTLGWTELVSWGILTYTFSVLLVPMQRDLGWSAGLITGAYSLALLVSGLVAPTVGRWIDRHGGREIMTAGSILGALLLLAWSHVRTPVEFYLLWILMGIAFAATLYEPAFATVAPWFHDNRGKALLIISFLGGLASTASFPLTSWLEVAYGWRHALYVLTAILAVNTILPHWHVLRPPPRSPETPVIHTPTQSTVLLRDAWFQRISIAFFLQVFTISGISVHLVAYLLEKGLDPHSAAWMAGLIGVAQTVARVLVTVFEDIFEPEQMTYAMFALQAGALTMLVLSPGKLAIFVAVMGLGFGRGAYTLLRPAILLKYYRVEEFGNVNGTLAFVVTLANAFAPVAAGVALGLLGGYSFVIASYAVLMVAAIFALWATHWVPAPSKLIHDTTRRKRVGREVAP